MPFQSKHVCAIRQRGIPESTGAMVNLLARKQAVAVVPVSSSVLPSTSTARLMSGQSRWQFRWPFILLSSFRTEQRRGGRCGAVDRVAWRPLLIPFTQHTLKTLLMKGWDCCPVVK